jgi:hypothetical protein
MDKRWLARTTGKVQISSTSQTSVLGCVRLLFHVFCSSFKETKRTFLFPDSLDDSSHILNIIFDNTIKALYLKSALQLL